MNDGKDAKVDAHRKSMQKRTQRSDFNKLIKQEIEEQACRAAKRRKVSDPIKPSLSFSEDACKILGTESIKAQIPFFEGFPVTIFIDKTGKVLSKFVSLHSYSELAAKVTELLAE